jgi:hypothetical protein
MSEATEQQFNNGTMEQWNNRRTYAMHDKRCANGGLRLATLP